ncbi:MAG: hypothetical protein AB8B55_14570, partial [Mariniblastus sp.]
MSTKISETPRYVLNNDKQAFMATIKSDDPKTKCVCVYGFSGKLIYDQFVKSAGKPLTPFPLVKRLLSNHIDEENRKCSGGDCSTLVILDATDETQSVVSAASMASVLLAFEEKKAQIPIQFEFVFDAQTKKKKIKNATE